MYDHLNTREKVLDALIKSQDRVATLSRHNAELVEEIKRQGSRLMMYEEKGRHFDTMIKVTKENLVVKDAWDKFVMSLRITGYDKTE